MPESVLVQNNLRGGGSDRLNLWFMPNFQALFGGQAVSNLGDQLYNLALPWFMYEATHDALAVSAVTSINLLPRLFLGPFVGALSDRWNRLRMMRVSALVSGVLVAAMSALHSLHLFSLPAAYGLAFGLAISSLFYSIAFGASIPDVFGRDRLAEVNGQLSLADSGVRLIGPSLAGLMIARFGPVQSLWFDAASFLVLVGALLMLRPLVPSSNGLPKERPGFWTEVVAGLDFLLRQRVLLQVVLLILAMNVGMAIVMALFVFHLRDTLHLSAELTGLVFASGSVGSIAGGILAGRIVKRWPKGPTLLGSGVLAGLGVLALAVVQNAPVVSVAYGVTLAAVTVVNVLVYTLRHELTPAELLGRVVGTTNSLARLSAPIAALLGGSLALYLGSRETLAAAGAFVLAVAVFGWFTAVRSVK